MSAAPFVATAVVQCFGHCDPTRLDLKAEIIGSAFRQYTLRDLDTMNAADLTTLIKECVPCVPDIGSTADCLARTIVLALAARAEAEQPRKRRREGEADDAPAPARPRPEEPFERMSSHALSLIARDPSDPVSARLAFKLIAERRGRLRDFRRLAERHFGARGSALSFEEYAAMSIARLAALCTASAVDAAHVAIQAALLLRTLPAAAAQCPDAIARAPLGSIFDVGYPGDSIERSTYATLQRLAAPTPVSRDDRAYQWALTCFARNRRSSLARALEILPAAVPASDINTKSVLALARTVTTTDDEAATLCGVLIAAIDTTRPLQSRSPGLTSAQLYEELGATCTVAELCGVPCDDATRNVPYVPTGDTDSDSE
jgi:hypothetical protein